MLVKTVGVRDNNFQKKISAPHIQNAINYLIINKNTNFRYLITVIAVPYQCVGCYWCGLIAMCDHGVAINNIMVSLKCYVQTEHLAPLFSTQKNDQNHFEMFIYHYPDIRCTNLLFEWVSEWRKEYKIWVIYL